MRKIFFPINSKPNLCLCWSVPLKCTKCTLILYNWAWAIKKISGNQINASGYKCCKFNEKDVGSRHKTCFLDIKTQFWQMYILQRCLLKHILYSCKNARYWSPGSFLIESHHQPISSTILSVEIILIEIIYYNLFAGQIFKSLAWPKV